MVQIGTPASSPPPAPLAVSPPPLMYASPASGVTAGPGAAPGAAQFTASNRQYLKATGSAPWAASGAFTVGLWVNFDAVSGLQMLAQKGDVGGGYAAAEWELVYVAGAGFQFYFSAGSTGSVATAAVTPVVGSWYYVRGWYDPTGPAVGVEVNASGGATAAFPGTPNAGTRDVNVGFSVQGNNHALAGRVGSLFVYRRTLTAAETGWVYNGGSGRVAADLGRDDAGANLVPAAGQGDWFDFTEARATRTGAFHGLTLSPDPSSGPTAPTYSPAGIPRTSGLAPAYPSAAAQADQSASGADLAPTSPSDIPAVVANAFGGRPALLYSGLGGSMSTARAVLGSRGMTAFLWLKPSSATRDIMEVLQVPSAALVAGGALGPVTVAVATPSAAALGNQSPYVGFANAPGGGVAGTSGPFTGDMLGGGVLAVTYNGGGAGGNSQFLPANTYAWWNGTPVPLAATGNYPAAVARTTVGGTAAGRCFDGLVGDVILYDHALSVTDVNLVLAFLADKSGLTLATATGGFPDVTRPQVVCDGNSLVAGSSLPAPGRFPAQLAVLLGSGWDVTNLGADGRSTEQQVWDAQSTVDSLWWYQRARNVCVAFEAVNSMKAGVADSAATAYAAMATYVRGRKAAGYQVVLISAPAATAASLAGPGYPDKQAAYDALVLANTAGADALVFPSQVPELSDPTNTVYVYDGLHYTPAGAGVLAAHVRAAVAGLGSPNGPGLPKWHNAAGRNWHNAAGRKWGNRGPKPAPWRLR